MKCEEIKGLFPNVLTGELDRKSRDEFEAHVGGCEGCREELARLSEIWTKLGVLPAEQPSGGLRDRFYVMLEAYKEGLDSEAAAETGKRSRSFVFPRQWFHAPAFRFAASLVLLAAGAVAGAALSGSRGEMARLRSEVDNIKRTAAVSLLQQPSPSERLLGVGYSAELREPGANMLGTLLQTLDTDPSVNVRLAAVDALYLFSSRPEVKEGVLRSLTRQESPIIQAALIDLLVDIRERKAVEALKTLIGNAALAPEIKKKAELGIRQLSF